MSTMNDMFLGLDIGAWTLKAAVLRPTEQGYRVEDSLTIAHHGQAETMHKALATRWAGRRFAGAAATGRLAARGALPRLPLPKALAVGLSVGRPSLRKATVVDIGSQGIVVVDRRGDRRYSYRTNSRCAQGSGSFLRQLTSRFGLSVEQADALCEAIADPAALSGRCPVILNPSVAR